MRTTPAMFDGEERKVTLQSGYYIVFTLPDEESGELPSVRISTDAKRPALSGVTFVDDLLGPGKDDKLPITCKIGPIGCEEIARLIAATHGLNVRPTERTWDNTYTYQFSESPER